MFEEKLKEESFDIIFEGEISKGSEISAVKLNLAKLFKANDALMAKLFGGAPIAIKRGASKAEAMKYRALMKKAGALSVIRPSISSDLGLLKRGEPTHDQGSSPDNNVRKQLGFEPSSSQQNPDVTSNSLSSAPSLSHQPDWTIAPPGADVGQLVIKEEADIPSTSHISIADLGVDMKEQTTPKPNSPLPDISAMEIVELGSDLGDKKEELAFEDAIESTLSLSPPGTPVCELSSEPVELDIDISHLTI